MLSERRPLQNFGSFSEIKVITLFVFNSVVKQKSTRALKIDEDLNCTLFIH